MTEQTNHQKFCQDADIAFHDAMAEGRLSPTKTDPNFVECFMYMGRRNGKDLFKHYASREYLD